MEDTNMKKWIATVITTALLITSVCGGNHATVKAAPKTSIAAWDLSYSNLYDTDTKAAYIDTSNPKNVVTGGKISLDLADKYGSKDNGYKATSGSGLLFAYLNGDGKRKLEWSGDKDKFKDGSSEVYAPVMTAGKKNLWNVNKLPYFEIQFSTTGYEDLVFSAKIGATKKGPKSYRMAYKVGNSGTYTTLTDASSQLNLTVNKSFSSISAKLPTVAQNQSLVYVKIYATSAETIAGASLSDDTNSGKIGINHISVQGAAIQKTKPKTTSTTNGQNGNSLATPSITKAILKNKKVTIRIKKVAGASGYQIKVGSNKKLNKNKKNKYVTNTKAVIKKWKAKKCYVKVRAYKTGTGNKRIYGKWSAVKQAKK